MIVKIAHSFRGGTLLAFQEVLLAAGYESDHWLRVVLDGEVEHQHALAVEGLVWLEVVVVVDLRDQGDENDCLGIERIHSLHFGVGVVAHVSHLNLDGVGGGDFVGRISLILLSYRWE